MRKRILAFMIVICLLVSIVPAAFATETNTNPYEGKIISIMGDSISTFEGQPHSERNRYPGNASGSGVDEVTDTWWMQLITELNAKLGICEARGSSTVTNIYDTMTSDGRKGPTIAMASWDRINDLDENGTPDVIIVYGGTNDKNAVYRDKLYEMGTFDPETAPAFEDYDPTTDTAIKWNNVVEGFVAMILRMKATYPDAEIIALLPRNGSADNFNTTIKPIYDHYGIPTVSLEDVPSTGIWDVLHPNAYGMDYITAKVKAAMLGETMQYPVYHEVTVQEAPADAYNDTNLWPAAPEAGYYASYKWVAKYSSMTLAVKEGDQVYASSFKAKGENGSTSSNGIVAAYIADGVVTRSLSKEEVYAAYLADGYLTIPAGVDAINIPMWTNDANSVVNLKNLPENPNSEPSDDPSGGATEEDPVVVPESLKYLVTIPEDATCEDNLWSLLGYHTEYWKGSEWSSNYNSITIPVQEGDKVYANSFKAMNENGSTSRYGIVLSFFDKDGNMIWNPGPTSDVNATSGTYYEYVKNGGYLIAPEGAAAVNIPMWKTNASSEVKLLSLPAPIDAVDLTVTAPAADAAPEAAVSGTNYAGTISWSPAVDGTFAEGTAYTATVTLTAADGYLFRAETTATVNGETATAQRGADGKLTVTYEFPKTDEQKMSSVELNVTAPVVGKAPATIISGAGYVGAISWSPAVDGTFAEKTVYTATVTLTANADHQFAQTVTGTINGETVAFTVNADGTVSGSITFAQTGNLQNAHLAEIPEGSYNNTNLWKALTSEGKVETGYYDGTQWVAGTYSSITIPVEPGDKVYASSVQSKGMNGYTADGMGITYLLGDDIVAYRTAAQTYAEYAENGYLTVPAGVNAVNIPMWVNDAKSIVYLLDLPDDPNANPSSVSIVAIPDESFNDTELWN